MNTALKLVSIRIPDKMGSRLECLAKVVNRSKSHLVAEAIEAYLEIHEWQVQAIKAGLQEIKQGAVIDFDKVKQLLAK